MRCCAAVLTTLLCHIMPGLAQAASQTRTSAYVYDAVGQLVRGVPPANQHDRTVGKW
jgi:hypothetical protein